MKVAALLPLALWANTALAKVRVAGVNIYGCDNGCYTNGTCSGPSRCPSGVGPQQMNHFSSDDKLNIFRLPVGWQYLVNHKLGGPLDQSYFKKYDALVQSCLKTGARCVIDIHNYARWNGKVIGQGGTDGPTDEQFVHLWQQLAMHYRSQGRVVFGVMNEPHNLNLQMWADTVQKVVTAIRMTGAKSQWILLPGTDYTNAASYASTSGPAMDQIKNVDGTKKNLFFDVHNYYDPSNEGKTAKCVTDHIDDSYQPLADYLHKTKRMALLSETGGGNTASCTMYVCGALSFLNQNSDVYLGWIGWAAGSFGKNYALSEVPDGDKDTLLVQKCIAGKFQ